MSSTSKHSRIAIGDALRIIDRGERDRELAGHRPQCVHGQSLRVAASLSAHAANARPEVAGSVSFAPV
jgi:hypothetical protein